MATSTHIARRQMAGDAVGCLLHPQAAQPTRNHAMDNLRAIRERERQARGKAVMQAQQAKPPELFKMRQFADAKPRVGGGADAKAWLKAAAILADEASAAQRRGRPSRPGSSEDGGVAGMAREIREKQNEKEAGVGPDEKAKEAAVGPDEDVMDLATFEKEIEALKRKHGGKANQMREIKKDADGCPSYLRKIKRDMAQKETDAVAARNPDAPPGYRRLPVEEIAETLKALRTKRLAIEKEFQALPLKIETEVQKRREKAVMSKIEESEKAIRMFSQPAVFVEV